MTQDDGSRTPGRVPRTMERIGFVEGLAVLVLIAVGFGVLGAATHQTWPWIVAVVLLVLVIADAVTLTLARRRIRR